MVAAEQLAQKGHVQNEVSLASGECRTIVVTSVLPKDAYILVEPLAISDSLALQGIVVTEAVSLCFDGKHVVICVTNCTTGNLLLSKNTPICSLRIVRPEFEAAALKQVRNTDTSRTSGPAPAPAPGPVPAAPAVPVPAPLPGPGPAPAPMPAPAPAGSTARKRARKQLRRKGYQLSQMTRRGPSRAQCAVDRMEEGDPDPLMPALLPAGQVGAEESDDEEGDIPPGLMETDSGEESEEEDD